MSKPLVLIPAYSHVDHRLLRVLRRLGLPHLEVFGCSDLVRARSGLVSDGLQTEADRFVFIDADILPSEDDVVQLAESNKLDAHNAVSGCYEFRPGKLAAQCEDDDPTLFCPERFTPLLVAGMGFAVVHRDAVERVRTSLPQLEDDTQKIWYPFFLPAVVQQQTTDGLMQEYLPEDYSFWWRLRLAQTNLWLDTHLIVGHVKQSVWKPIENVDGKNYSWASGAPVPAVRHVDDFLSSMSLSTAG